MKHERKKRKLEVATVLQGPGSFSSSKSITNSSISEASQELPLIKKAKGFLDQVYSLFQTTNQEKQTLDAQNKALKTNVSQGQEIIKIKDEIIKIRDTTIDVLQSEKNVYIQELKQSQESINYKKYVIHQLSETVRKLQSEKQVLNEELEQYKAGESLHGGSYSIVLSELGKHVLEIHSLKEQNSRQSQELLVANEKIATLESQLKMHIESMGHIHWGHYSFYSQSNLHAASQNSSINQYENYSTPST